MKIKIVKPAEWYTNLVGKEFEVHHVTRHLSFNGHEFTHVNFEVENFRKVYKELYGKYPEEKESSEELIALAIHINDAVVTEI